MNLPNNNLFILEDASIKLSNSIVISGSGRSGTTILGQLIHSMDDVEYIFEPPQILSLMCLIDKLDENSWKLLYETYLYEDFLMNTLAGRSINTNKNDDSCIYHVKSAEEINKRITSSHRKVTTVKLSKNSVVAYKTIGTSKQLSGLKKYYPSTRIIGMLRNGPDTIYSILQKEWFKEKSLNQIYPFKKYLDKFIPYFVDEDDKDYWLELDEINKAVYYYIKINEDQKNIKDIVFIKYGELIKDPYLIANQLAEKLNLKFGPLTVNILSKIKPQKAEIKFDISNKILPEMKSKFLELSHFSDMELT